MSSKSKKVEDVVNEPIKSKRGRKSKKELMASLNMNLLVGVTPPIQNVVNISVSEIENDCNDDDTDNNIYSEVLKDDLKDNMIVTSVTNLEEQKIPKKRGRKPKGGKIIQQVLPNMAQKEEIPNIILHLRCSMKDLQTHTQNYSFVESYNALGCKNDLNYELLENENVNKTHLADQQSQNQACAKFRSRADFDQFRNETKR